MAISLVDSAELSYAVTQQRGDITTKIAEAGNPGELEEAEWLIRFVAASWLATGYGYKVQELRARVVARANDLLDVWRIYHDELRPGSKSRAEAKKDIERFERLAAL